MPLPQNFHAFLGAAVLGVVSAAGMFIYQQLRQEKQRQTMAQDLARLDKELTQVKKELNQILSKQKEKGAKKSKPKKNAVENSLLSSSSTLDDYTSPSELDSSDMEFYDVSDDEGVVDSSNSLNLQVLKEIDCNLDSGDLKTLQDTLEDLKGLSEQHPDNPEVLWRVGKAHYKLYEKLDEGDYEARKEHTFKGTEACDRAIKCDHNSVAAHKWLAILIGSKSDFLPMKERILNSHEFKKHVHTALGFDQKDEALHHMLGRLAYELAGLKWYERKAAATFLAEPPTGSYEEAKEHFQQAEKLSEKEWKVNKLYLAKCEIGLGYYKKALDWLHQADKIDDPKDEKTTVEIKKLLKQYGHYR